MNGDDVHICLQHPQESRLLNGQQEEDECFVVVDCSIQAENGKQQRPNRNRDAHRQNR